MFGMRYTPCRNMPRKRSKSTEMPERGYRGVSGNRKHTTHRAAAGHLRHICLYTSKCAGIRRVSPHMLRHTFATRMIENGSDAKSLALIIGHSNPAFTLRRYVHPNHTSLYEQMCRLSSVQQ